MAGTVEPTQGTPPFLMRRLSVAEWVRYCAGYMWASLPPVGVVLHHTYKPTVESWRGHTSMVGMQTFYREQYGWSSAPHIYVGPDGIWLATPMNKVGIHAGRGNGWPVNGIFRYTIGVEMVGYYDYKQPSGAVWAGTTAVLGELCRKLGKSPRSLISFHRDYTDEKSCPGWAVTKEWVWSEVSRYMAQPATGDTIKLPPLALDYHYKVKQGARAVVREDYRETAPIALASDPVLQQELAILEPGTFVDGRGINQQRMGNGQTRPWLHLVSQLGWIEMSALEPR